MNYYRAVEKLDNEFAAWVFAQVDQGKNMKEIAPLAGMTSANVLSHWLISRSHPASVKAILARNR